MTNIVSNYIKNLEKENDSISKISKMNPTFLVEGKKKEVVKIMSTDNLISNTRKSKQASGATRELCNRSNSLFRLIRLPSINSIEALGDSWVIRYDYQGEERVRFSSFEEVEMFLSDLKQFHTQSTKLARFYPKQKWDLFPKEYWSALHKAKRAKEIKYFMETQKPYDFNNHKNICHNDLHYGNLVFTTEDIVLVDFDEMAIVDIKNDIGMAIANMFYDYIDDFNGSIRDLTKAALDAYRYPKIDEENISDTIRYGVRKLFHAEAYFWYLQENNEHLEIIANLKERAESMLSNIN